MNAKQWYQRSTWVFKKQSKKKKATHIQAKCPNCYLCFPRISLCRDLLRPRSLVNLCWIRFFISCTLVQLPGSMATKPLTTESIALTEKKMDMALDDIIKLSKTAGTKPKSRQRAPIKNKKIVNNQAQDKAMKVRRYMDSRSSLRQGVLAQRRSSFQGNQFPLATEVARKAAAAPLNNKAFGHNRVANWNKQRVGAPVAVHRRPANRGFASKPSRNPPQQQKQQQQGNGVSKQRPQTLDSLFANMKEQRMRVISRQNNVAPRNGGGPHRLPWGRGGRFGN